PSSGTAVSSVPILDPTSRSDQINPQKGRARQGGRSRGALEVEGTAAAQLVGKRRAERRRWAAAPLRADGNELSVLRLPWTQRRSAWQPTGKCPCTTASGALNLVPPQNALNFVSHQNMKTG